MMAIHATRAAGALAQALPSSDETTRIYRKITWRLIPFLFICYVAAYLDRINIGFAQLQMKQDLGFSDAVYGLGAGIFFFGYMLFEVPSNLLLEKIGARKTLLRIMVIWGLISTGMMFVQTPTQLYIARFLLRGIRGRLFPRHHLIFDLLVSIRNAGSHYCTLHVWHCDRRDHRRTAIRLDHERSCRREWLERLAVDVSA
jgi:hypothetical protein